MKTLIVYAVLCIAATLSSRAAHAEDALAKCYLMGWHTATHVAPRPAQVREWADIRCSVKTPVQMARLRSILAVERLRPGTPPTRDLRFVVDIRRSGGGVESYYADRFGLMSADMGRWRRIGGGFRKDIDRFVRFQR